MADTQAYADATARPLAASRQAMAEAIPLPRTVGFTLALGLSLAMWAVLIEAGIRLWSILP